MESFRQYQQEKPGLDITLSKTAANRITNSIDRGKADAAICCSEVFVNSLDIISKNFLKFTYVVALRANHPLASLPSIPPEKLMGMGCVTLQDTSTASEQHIQDFTSTINLKFKSKIRTSNIEDFFFELGLNAYYGLIPDYFVPYINTGFICRSIADTNLPQYHLALCYKKENHNSALQWLHYSLLRN